MATKARQADADHTRTVAALARFATEIGTVLAGLIVQGDRTGRPNPRVIECRRAAPQGLVWRAAPGSSRARQQIHAAVPAPLPSPRDQRRAPLGRSPIGGSLHDVAGGRESDREPVLVRCGGGKVEQGLLWTERQRGGAADARRNGALPDPGDIATIRLGSEAPVHLDAGMSWLQESWKVESMPIPGCDISARSDRRRGCVPCFLQGRRSGSEIGFWNEQIDIHHSAARCIAVRCPRDGRPSGRSPEYREPSPISRFRRRAGAQIARRAALPRRRPPSPARGPESIARRQPIAQQRSHVVLPSHCRDRLHPLSWERQTFVADGLLGRDASNSEHASPTSRAANAAAKLV